MKKTSLQYRLPKWQQEPLKIFAKGSPNKSFAIIYQDTPDKKCELHTPPTVVSPSPSSDRKEEGVQGLICASCVNTNLVMNEIKEITQKIMQELKKQLSTEIWFGGGQRSGVVSQLQFILGLVKQRHIRGTSPEVKKRIGLVRSQESSPMQRTPESAEKARLEKYSPRHRSPGTKRQSPRLCYSRKKEGSQSPEGTPPQPKAKFMLPKGKSKTISETVQKPASPNKNDLARNYLIEDYQKSVNLVKDFVEIHSIAFPKAISSPGSIASSERIKLLSDVLKSLFNETSDLLLDKLAMEEKFPASPVRNEVVIDLPKT